MGGRKDPNLAQTGDKSSWTSLLRDLKQRACPRPGCGVGDGALASAVASQTAKRQCNAPRRQMGILYTPECVTFSPHTNVEAIRFLETPHVDFPLRAFDYKVRRFASMNDVYLAAQLSHPIALRSDRMCPDQSAGA